MAAAAEPFVDYYKELSDVESGLIINENSSESDIKKAWKFQINQSYPILNELDKDQSNPRYIEANRRVQILNDAKDILTDVDKRQKFERQLAQYKQSNPPKPKAAPAAAAPGPQVNTNFAKDMEKRRRQQEEARRQQEEARKQQDHRAKEDAHWQEVQKEAAQRQATLTEILKSIFEGSKTPTVKKETILRDIQDLAKYRDEILLSTYMNREFKEKALKKMLEFISHQTRRWIYQNGKAISAEDLSAIRQELWKWREELLLGLSPDLADILVKSLKYHQEQIQKAYYSLFSKGEMELRVLDKLNETSHLKSSEIYKQLHPITDNFIQDNPETHYRQTDSHYKVFEGLESGLEAMFNDPNYTWAKPEYKNNVLDSASKLLNSEALRYVQTKPSLREDQGDRPPAGWSEDFLRIAELIRSKRSEYPKQAAEMDTLLDNIEINSKNPEIKAAVKLHKKQFPAKKKRGWCDIFG